MYIGADMSNISTFETRELWLQTAVEAMKPLFKQHGYDIPKLRVACGWPVRGGLGKRKRVLGECWDKKASEDKTLPQIFISPWLFDAADPSGILPTLVHEVVHAVVGHEAKHGKIFSKCARAVGLEGKLTATHAGEELLGHCKTWAEKLGPYPHSKLDALKEPSKKQGTRLLKAECIHEHGEDICGYTCRITRKWLDEIGAPHCPMHGEMAIVEPAAKEDDDNE